jgi:hypothetical protein
LRVTIENGSVGNWLVAGNKILLTSEEMKLGLACFILFQFGFCLFVFTHPTITGLFDASKVSAGGNQRTLLETTVVTEETQDGENEFLTLATKAGTDKVTTHQYQHAYHTFLAPYRHKPVKILEIGLGCNMAYGPGKSASLWNEYFTHPDAQIFFFEYDVACLKKWSNATITKFPRITLEGGDQSNVKTLEAFIQRYGRETFDIIIDDGGHHMHQQWTSLHVLWDAVKPGGMHTTFPPASLKNSFTSFLFFQMVLTQPTGLNTLAHQMFRDLLY